MQLSLSEVVLNYRLCILPQNITLYKQLLFPEKALSNQFFVLFNYAVTCYDYTTAVTDELTNLDNWLMSLTADKWSPHRETCFGTTLSITNLTLSQLGLKQCFRCDRPVTDCVSDGMTKQLVFITKKKCVFCAVVFVWSTFSIYWVDTVLLIHHSYWVDTVLLIHHS